MRAEITIHDAARTKINLKSILLRGHLPWVRLSFSFGESDYILSIFNPTVQILEKLKTELEMAIEAAKDFELNKPEPIDDDEIPF